MSLFSVLDPYAWHPEYISQHPLYVAGQSYGYLTRHATKTAADYLLAGRLYISKSGWLLLSVPNALVRGLFDALTAPGAELPLTGVLNVPNMPNGALNAHMSVMTPDEVEKIGPEKITERGHTFHYALGGLKEVPVSNIDGVSRIWVVQAASPALTALRKSYGLSPQPPHGFHVTVAVRRKHIFSGGSTSKAAADLLPGGAADDKPDTAFPADKLQEGAEHEREHTRNPEIAKEIAKDHLSEEPNYYAEHQKDDDPQKIEKKARSVYLNQLWRNFDLRRPISYDHTKPVFANIQNQLAQVKRRGDFIIDAQRNNQLYRAALDPRYRYQLALKAFRGDLPQESWADQFIHRHGNSLLGQIQHWGNNGNYR
jgi:hypothetical protein